MPDAVPEPQANMGVPVPRIDARAKVTGAARYPADEPVPPWLNIRSAFTWRAFSCVRMSSTPGTARAAAVSSRATRPRAMALVTQTADARDRDAHVGLGTGDGVGHRGLQ